MNFLKNIADKAAKSVADSPIRSLGRGGDYDGGEDVDGGAGPGSQEGFICPLCIASFQTPESLQGHYETSHTGGEADLAHTSPIQEKRFGSLDIQSHNGHNGPGPGQAEEEQQSYLNQVLANQVAALEESKQLLTAELIAARQQLTQLEADHVPGGKVLERANQLAAENVGLKAAVDELTGERVTLQDRISSLEAEKASRDSKDDTAVLKQELINVQRAMDEALKEKEEEFNKLRKSYDDLFYEKQNLIDTVSQKDGELTSMKNKLSDVNGDKSTLEESYQTESQQLTDEKEKLTLKLKEKDDMIKARDDKILNLSRTLEQKITLLEDKLENEKELKAIIEESKSLSRSKSEEIDKIQMSFEALQKKESKAMEKLEAQEASIIEHQEKLLLEKKEKDSINSALNSTEARVSKLTSEAEERTSAMHNLNVELEEKTTEISRLQSERQELLAKIEAGEGVSEAIQQLKAENLLLQDKVSDNLNDFKVRESDLNSKIEDLEASIVSLKTQCKEMESKYKETLESGEDKQKLLQHSEAEKEVLLSQVSEMEREVERLKEVQKKSVMDHEDAMTAIQDDLREKDKVYQKIKSKCDKAEQDILALEDSVRELESKLSLSNSEKDTLVESNEKLTETVTKEKQHVEKLLRSLNDANDRDAECIEKIKSLEDKLKEEAQNIKLLKQAKTLVQEEKYGIEKLLEEKSTECQDKVVVLEANRFRIQELETGLADTEVKVNEMRTAIEEAVGKERNLLSDIEEKNKTIFAIEEEKASIVISFESQQTILERLTGEKDSAEGQVRKCKAEMESLEEKICQLQTHSEMEKTKSAEEMMELRTAKDLLLSQIVDLKHDKESLAASIVLETEASQARVAALEIKLQDSKLGQEKVRGELDRERTQHADTQRRGGEEREDLARRLEEAGTKVDQLTEDGAKVRGLLATAESERDEALSRSLELEAGVSSALEERRGLLERCVAAEAETERTRNMTVELRRKLDDANAALHELGRENQSIQVELVKQSGRKWKDDSEVVACTSCSQAFSLTNRKHHCRNCGDIFCKDCSSKQAIIDGYKKPQRVCESCFAELGSGK